MLYLRTHVLVKALATVTGTSLAGRLMVVVNIYQKEELFKICILEVSNDLEFDMGLAKSRNILPKTFA